MNKIKNEHGIEMYYDRNTFVDKLDILDSNGKYFLKDSFITDDTYYQNIIYDGYLIGYNSEQDLEEKYNNVPNKPMALVPIKDTLLVRAIRKIRTLVGLNKNYGYNYNYNDINMK